ncbi:2-oxo acid dehydrogenase subunit E2 [Rhodoblastus acidophilus]|uniref:Dihydrolipoamide acetyltransferase component of pyruvate dehydrogenase complex n=1 Tax=Candidatus Rhodoblastus alkanivorans TaxID=2954117 RepID=A0ABS9Z7W3_9HYPH|nr:dihydrolipoamide acetyltransferase family protein [Candidatus Rhodoblastus alkanivorans]MCI4679668.1 2-oxo acid dehydrogenase subunit E2 [Candidatus Rhodoblastus alkanivorans]MCI4683704.1 2-oxo acid dehydrogenase subunit E2 [Candidatus Rhodoblastus alkanivorans]MDI4641021.1 2-oxo acid dehydrogenase subunit E2 [Rhodoblastus acidophilus]
MAGGVIDFRMPSLGADMEAGTLVEWRVKANDNVKHGDIVAVVETQKGAIEIEVFESGEIAEILVKPGEKVPVGTPLARIRVAVAAEAAAREPSAPAAAHAALTERPPAMPVRAGVSRETGGRVPASPAARELARSLGVDLATIAGSGADGAIVREDVLRSQPATEGKRPVGLDLGAMREAIAAAMARSKREIPHYYLQHQIDVTPAEEWLAQRNAGRPPADRLLFVAVAMKAVALALKRFPNFNGFWREGKFEPSSVVHVGTAIAIRGGGLAAPALHNVDKLSLDGLMTRLRDLVQRMRAGRIRGSEIVDATITVSSLGERGVEALFGIIYPPQVALVGFGTITRRPWLVGDIVQARPIVTVTLAGDHRVSDGHAGALFLAEIGKLLQEPEKL